MGLNKNEKHIVVAKELHRKVKIQAADYGDDGINMKDLVNKWSDLHDAIDDESKQLGISIEESYDLVYAFVNNSK